MKFLLVIIVFIALLFNSVKSYTQALIKMDEMTGKYGVIDIRTSEVRIQSDYDKIFKVLKSYRDNGFICKRGNVWSYYSQSFKFIKDSIDMDNWIGNSMKDDAWVLKDSLVYLYDFDSLRRKAISSDTINYKPGQLIAKANTDTLFGLFNTDGKILVDFKWEHCWIMLNTTQNRLPILFTHDNYKGGAFYDEKGNLILEFDLRISYLGLKNQPYLRIYESAVSDSNSRVALGFLNISEKRIEFLTEYEFIYILMTTQKDENGEVVAKAAYPDKKEVYIYSDGSTKPTN